MKQAGTDIEKLERRLNRSGEHHRGVGRRKLAFVLFRGLGRACSFLLEWALALVFFLLWTAPLLAILLCRRVFTGRAVFDRVLVYGRGGRPAQVRYFNCRNYLWRNGFLFFHVLTGDLRLVGVSIKPYNAASRAPGDACLHEDRPGVFNLWFLRSSARIAHEGRLEIEREYRFKSSPGSDVMLVLRSLPAMLFHIGETAYRPNVNLLGISFRNVTMSEAVDTVDGFIAGGMRKRIFFVNADCFNRAFGNRAYTDILAAADCVFPDGIGIHLACKLLNNPLRENINGTDMLPFLCRMALRRGYSFYLLGGKPGVAEKMRENLEKQYPGLRIAGTRDGYFDRNGESDGVVDIINSAAPDILLVAFGVPLQEYWITEHFSRLRCPVAIGVGGLFDFYSGNIRRAPKWMREIGLEWFYRLMMEPHRMFYRYMIGNPLFLWRFITWHYREKRKNE